MSSWNECQAMDLALQSVVVEIIPISPMEIRVLPFRMSWKRALQRQNFCKFSKKFEGSLYKMIYFFWVVTKLCVDVHNISLVSVVTKKCRNSYSKGFAQCGKLSFRITPLSVMRKSQNGFTRSSDSTPSVSALFGVVLIEKLPRSSLSAHFSLY